MLTAIRPDVDCIHCHSPRLLVFLQVAYFSKYVIQQMKQHDISPDWQKRLASGASNIGTTRKGTKGSEKGVRRWREERHEEMVRLRLTRRNATAIVPSAVQQ